MDSWRLSFRGRVQASITPDIQGHHSITTRVAPRYSPCVNQTKRGGEQKIE